MIWNHKQLGVLKLSDYITSSIQCCYKYFNVAFSAKKSDDDDWIECFSFDFDFFLFDRLHYRDFFVLVYFIFSPMLVVD